jgi:hypothetical protein
MMMSQDVLTRAAPDGTHVAFARAKVRKGAENAKRAKVLECADHLRGGQTPRGEGGTNTMPCGVQPS